MKTTFAVLFAVSALAAQSQAAIVITEVMSSTAHPGGTNNGDWFELTNTGIAAVDISGWHWDDNTFTNGTTPEAVFGGITSIAAGKSIIFTEETVGAEAGWTTSWGITGVTVVNLGSSVFQGLGAGGDSVRVYDASNTLVSGVTFGASSTGFTFEWDVNGNYLGISSLSNSYDFKAATNGATSPGPGVDVGSPGVAVVPEPTSALVLGLSLVTLVGVGRKRKSAGR